MVEPMHATLVDSSQQPSGAARQRLTGFLVVAAQAAALGYVTKTFAFPIGISLLALYGVFSPQRVAWSKNQRLVVFLALAVLFSAKYRLLPHQLSLDALFIGTRLTLVMGQFLLVIQVGQFFLARDRDRLPLWLPAIGAAAMVFVTNVRVSPDERRVCQFLTLAFIAAAALFFGASRLTYRRERARARWQRPLVQALVLLSVAGASWGAATAVFRYERHIELWVANLLIARGQTRSELGFSRMATLGGVELRKQTAADRVALRVYSSIRPGYLRGMAYDEFTGRVWQVSVSGRDVPPVQRPPTRIAERAPHENVFLVTPADSPAWDHLEIWPAPTLEGTLFTRLRTSFVQAPTDFVKINDYDIVSADALPAGYPFATYAPLASARRDEFVPRNRQARMYLTDVDLLRDPRVHRLARRLTASCRTTEEKIAAVQSYFHDNYQYQLGTTVPANVADPLTWFLLDRPPAHCEFFATGTVFLLRAAGVPCRYVTGFVVTERNAVGRYWLARNRDAHAWAEAYDEQRGWVIVESTPAAGVPNSEAESRWVQFWEMLRESLQMFRIRLQQGGLEWLGRQLLRLLLTPGTVLLLSLAIAARVAWRLRKAFRLRDRSSDPVVRMSQRLLRRVDARLRRRELVRRPGETLHSFADRIERLADADAAMLSAAAWYRSYAELRYSGNGGAAAMRRLAATLPGRQRTGRG